MATDTFSTKLSRRKMLASGTVAALSATPLPAIAMPVLASQPADDGDDPDAELLRALALAERRRDEFNAARLERQCQFDAMIRRPDYPRMTAATVIDDTLQVKRDTVAERTGYRIALDRRNRANEAYRAAVRAAFAIPPHTPRGLYAKLGFAVRAVHEGDYGGHDHGDRDWLDIALADAARMAGPERA